MLHETPLISTIVVGLCLAFLFGIIANRLRISPLVGYLLAGVIVGPHTGGFNADPALANQLAEIGIILLMFGVGLHFSLKDLLSVKTIAVPGAIVQMAFATLLGIAFGYVMGWRFGTGLIFGLALSTASTVVLLRALQERRLIETEQGHIAVGWLIVEDLAMVLALVLVPALSGILGGVDNLQLDPLANWLNLGIWGIIGLTLAKVAVFIVLMLIVGRRVIPWFLQVSAQSGSRELFRLSVLAIALGVAFAAAHLFGVSFALGAFFAGMIMSESELSHRATEETLPLRDAFAVLFFVSVGMLFNPLKLVSNFFPLLLTLFIVIIGKSFAAFWIVRVFKRPNGTALTIAASLAQIGEFSFILAGIGTALHLIDSQARDLILGVAILSILLNPLVFKVAEKIGIHLENRANPKDAQTIIEINANGHENAYDVTTKTGHTIIVGYGTLGQKIAQSIGKIETIPVIIIEDSAHMVECARQDGFETIHGNAINNDILTNANIKSAIQLVLATNSMIEAGQMIEQTRQINRDIKIIAHATTSGEAIYLTGQGANIVVTDTEEIAKGMIKYLIDNRSEPEFAAK